MKRLHVLHWLAAAAVISSSPITARAAFGHGMGGFAGGGPRHSMGGFAAGGPGHSMGGFMRGGPHASMGPRFGRFGFRHDDRFFDHHRFVDHDRFFDHRFVDHDRFFDYHRFVDYDRFFYYRFLDYDRFFDHHHFVDHDRFFFSFDFVSFGFPWWYPWYPPYPAYYPYYPPYPSSYGYPYDSSYAGGGQEFDYQYWTNLAVSVQSELARRGYYHGPTDGLIGSDSREAIRAFQAAQGLPVSGVIDQRLLQALGIKYRSA